jgi:hypothetical protein
MKTIAALALTALQNGTAIVTGALKVATPSPLRVWGGYEAITLASESYTALGDRMLAQVSGGELGSAELGATIQLSGVDPDVLGSLDMTAARGVDAVVWRLIYDGSGTTLLDAQVFMRGRVDRLTQRDVPGGASTLVAQIEGAARGSGRRSGRMRSDADMRMRSAPDGGMKRISYAGDVTLYWGGKVPAQVKHAVPSVGSFRGRIAGAGLNSSTRDF